MRSKTTVKMCVDAGMTAALLLLMTYELIGDKIHEWLGVGMFVLFVLHHVLNRRWWAGLLKGKYSLLRVWQTLLVSLVLAAMLGSMVSGVILSRYALSFLPVRGMKTLGRTLHMLSAYWGMVFHGSASRTALGHDDGDGKEAHTGTVPDTHMGAADYCCSDCCLRCLCFWKTQYRGLYAASVAFCVF